MLKIIAICLALALSGCANMTPEQKTVALVVVGVAITAVAISASDDNVSTCKPSIRGAGSNFDFYCRSID